MNAKELGEFASYVLELEAACGAAIRYVDDPSAANLHHLRDAVRYSREALRK